MTTYAERNRKAEKSIRSMDNRLSLGLDDRNRSRTRSCPPLKGGRNTTPLIGNKKAVISIWIWMTHMLLPLKAPDDGSNRSESFLDARRGAYWSRGLPPLNARRWIPSSMLADAPKDPPEALEDLGPVALPPKDKGEEKHNVSLLRVATSSPPVSWLAHPCGNIGNCPCRSCTRRGIAPDPAARAPTHQADVGSPPKFSQWSPSSSPTTNSDLAFGADPFGDGAASEDLPQPESQPDSEGEPFYSELYPHCGCDRDVLD